MSAANTSKFRIGLVQMVCSVNPAENLEKAVWKIREASAQGAQIICLPELFRSQYFCQEENPRWFALAEPVPGPTTDALAAVAKERNVAIVAPVFERLAPGLYFNTAAVLDADGALIGRYRKMHIPDDPLYYEKFYFRPGDYGFCAFRTRYGRIGVLICWDQWFPEAARLTAMHGAAVLFYPTAIGWHPYEKAQAGKAQLEAWRTVQRGHAIANGVYVAAVNRTGHEGLSEAGLEFWGSSFVSDPFGQVLQEAPADREAILIAEIDPRHIEEVRRSWPFFRDRRVDAYGGLTKSWLSEEP